MRGTNYTVGFGVSIFFIIGGVAMFVLGEKLFPTGTAAQDLGSAGTTFRMIGGIWTGVAVLLFILFVLLRMRGSRRAHIAATGYPGTAIIRGVQQTGMYVNHNPQFRLTLDVASSMLPFGGQVVRNAVVPMTAMGRFGLGTQLPIRISREKPDDFEIIWDELPAPWAH